ncbi:PREDICTED: transcriptional regulator ATRX-like isoform X2 [Dinoponera quadriceps]|uniref:ATP-dependent helicase ATRX n=1 Tax=Dinoponera quadriceps TaxID=609295 RepID=A0A6P3Y0J5_DINQU|nr:PREDICTED: transcriptional regulator ATRX-like isoform X2 [Dinoponera quadriceps]
MMSFMKGIDTTKQELAYRDKHFHDIRIIKDRQVACTSCGNRLKIELGHIFSHPLLGILQCETCQKNFRALGEPSNKKRYCYICGQEKKLYICSDKKCFSAFCKNCIKRNTTLSLLDAEHEDWRCFVCKSKPLWELRAVCAAVLNALPKRCNRSNIFKTQIHTLPSQKETIAKTKRVQRSLHALCDDEDSISEPKLPYFYSKFMKFTKETHNQDSHRLKPLEVTLVDSSDMTSDNEEKIIKTKKNKKVKPIPSSQDSSSSSSASKPVVNKRDAPKKSKNPSDDSDDSSVVLSEEVIKPQHARRSHDRFTEKRKSRGNNVTDASNSESDKDGSTSKVPKTFNSSSGHAAEKDGKKDVRSHNVRTAKSKVNKYRYSTSESEDEDAKNTKQSGEKRPASRAASHNEERKRNNLKGKTREDDSDSSGKEFQREKLLHEKHSVVMRRLKDLDVDYTKSPAARNSSGNRMKKDSDDEEQMNVTFGDVKEVLEECKSICSTFQKYMEVIVGLYEKKDEEKLLLISARKVNEVMTKLSKKHKELTAFYELWSKKSRRSMGEPKKTEAQREVGRDGERSPSEETTNACVKRKTQSEKTDVKRKTHEEEEEEEKLREQDSKEVSECDSEEIFSADESRSSRKVQEIARVDVSAMDNSDVDTVVNEDNEQPIIDRLLEECEKSDENSRDDLIVSPVLGASEQKRANAEGPSKQSAPECASDTDNNKASSKNKDTEIEQSEPVEPENKDNTCNYSPEKTTNCETTTLRNNNVRAGKCLIDESMDDMFEDSFGEFESAEDTMEPRKSDGSEVKRAAHRTESTSDHDTGEIASPNDEANRVATADGDQIPNAEGREVSRPEGNENAGSEGRNELEKVAATTSNGNSRDVDNLNSREKADLDDAETKLAEILAKKTLLAESDSDDVLLNCSTSSLVNENSVIDDSKKSETADDANDTGVKAEANAEKKKKKSRKDKSSEGTRDKTKRYKDGSVEAEKAAKKALLASSTSEDSESQESEEIADKIDDKKLNAKDAADIKAKEALLASSNSDDDSSSDIQVSETETSVLGCNRRNRKRNHDSDAILSPSVKIRKLNLRRNHHYLNDEKLRATCEVRVTRLSKKILERYPHALQKSKQYLEHKALKSLVNLDKLEKRHKSARKDSDDDASTDDDDALSKISRRSNKGRGKQATKEAAEEESLMDHLKRIENNCPWTIEAIYTSDESVDRVAKVDDAPVSNEALLLEANRVAKQNLLKSSDSDADIEKPMASDSSKSSDDKSAETEDKKKKSEKKPEDKTSKQDENKKDKSGKSNWRRNKILTMKLSDTDSETEKKKWNKKQEKLIKKEERNESDEGEEAKVKKKKKKKGARRIIDSDSDIKLTDCDSDTDNSSKASDGKRNSGDSVISLGSVDAKKEKLKRKGRKRRDSKSSATDSSIEEKRPKPKRKRIKKMASDSDSSDAMQTSQGTPGKSGRKNIRKVLKDKQVADDTKQAAKEEEERLKRIAERQALYNEMYEMRLAGEEKLEKLVLDFDTGTKEELVSVHEDLVKRLKPHQAQGIKFMWDACYESLERIKSTSGSGCIIAHCMGLGKTLQVIALTHTLLTHETTGVKTVLVVCPLSTVLNWVHEYKTWLTDLDDDVNVYELTKFKKNFERKYQLQRWQQTGGVLIIGYEMFRNLTGANRNIRKGMKEAILECLVDPGPDLIICDEGHLLKNEDTALSKCIRMVKTMRRIVLTGTPLQNNLTEYHCMVQFVKPNLLGTKREFLNRFVNPITNGQFDDSTAYDVKLMKKRAHVLHKMLEGSVQRFDYSVLTPFLPPKQEYVIFVRLTETQIQMYQYYLANLARRHHGPGGSLFADFQALQRIWTHPVVLRLNAEKIEKANEKKLTSDSEGSLKDFINDDTTESDSSPSSSNSDSDVQAIDDIKNNVPRRKTRNNPGVEEEPEPSPKEAAPAEVEWWLQFVQPEHFEDLKVSAKLLLLFSILKECEQIGDKVLVFSQSLYSLTLIEEFLRKIDDETQKNVQLESLDNHTGSWALGLDYFRLDGQTSADNRSAWCRIFNRPTNTRARLFLISTRAGGLGINLTAANRVIIFDASWNPSHDVQSIFRIYRFGQKKPCYVYRFLAAGTMEEKIYNRQVTKLSLSCRVVDEQQIERHYSNHDLNELYMFEPYDKEKPTLNLPKDRLLAEIFLKYKDIVDNYLEHDSLLENKAEEELDEEERKQAWIEYEEEKKGKPPMVMSYQNNMLPQQYNLMMNADQSGMMSQNAVSLQMQYENLQQLIRKDFPNATMEQQRLMTNRALLDMYNYWERQAVLQPNRVQLPTYQPRMPVVQPTTSSNQSILNQLVTGQATNYMNINQPAQSGVNPLAKQFTYRNVPTNNTGNKDNEVAPSTSNVGTINTQAGQVVQPQAATNKNQEE